MSRAAREVTVRRGVRGRLRDVPCHLLVARNSFESVAQQLDPANRGRMPHTMFRTFYVLTMYVAIQAETACRRSRPIPSVRDKKPCFSFMWLEMSTCNVPTSVIARASRSFPFGFKSNVLPVSNICAVCAEWLRCLEALLQSSFNDIDAQGSAALTSASCSATPALIGDTPYNSVLCGHSSTKHVDFAVMMDDDALYSRCRRNVDIHLYLLLARSSHFLVHRTRRLHHRQLDV